MHPLFDWSTEKFEKPITYAVKHNDEDIRNSSQSGGAFTALSDAILNHDGVVYGCTLSDDFSAIHIRADNHVDRNRMHGSKYIQSIIGDAYKNVKIDLEAGRKVLFTGTSCQISGLYRFLENDYSYLYCVDIICHGVPSPLVWQNYLEWQKKKNKSEITNVNFRNKPKFGWKSQVETIEFGNTRQIDSTVFKNLFYRHNILRPSCYQCPYKNIIHPGNITIGDYWGIDQVLPEFNDNKGISLVLINDCKGAELFSLSKKDLQIRETKIEDCIQKPLISPYSEPDTREQFWIDFQDHSFDYIVNKYGKVSLLKRIKKKIKKIIMQS